MPCRLSCWWFCDFRTAFVCIHRHENVYTHVVRLGLFWVLKKPRGKDRDGSEKLSRSLTFISTPPRKLWARSCLAPPSHVMPVFLDYDRALGPFSQVIATSSVTFVYLHWWDIKCLSRLYRSPMKDKPVTHILREVIHTCFYHIVVFTKKDFQYFTIDI